MVYAYTCDDDDCKTETEVSGVKIDERALPQVCQCCGGTAHYDAMASIRGARTYYTQNYYSFLEKKYANNPHWQPPKTGGGHSEMERQGEERLRAARAFAQEKLREQSSQRGESRDQEQQRAYVDRRLQEGGLDPYEEAELCALLAEIKSRGFEPEVESQFAAMSRTKITSRPKQWGGGDSGSHRSYPGDPGFGRDVPKTST